MAEYQSIETLIYNMRLSSINPLFKGSWNANINSPALVNSTGTEGDLYQVSATGTTSLNGISSWLKDDYCVFFNGIWNKASTFNEQDLTIQFQQAYDTVYVGSLSDLPSPVSRNITLENNITYVFTRNVDLGTNYLTCGQNTVIMGYSSENCKITSTLNNGESLINSAYSLPIRNIDLSVSGTGAKILNLDATGNSNQALDWKGVNFSGGIIGTIKNYTNFVLESSAVLSCVSGFTFDGTIGTISISICLFGTISSGGTYLILPSTLTVSRRFRVVYSSFVVASGATGINVNSLTSIPTESYILDNINFSGAGTYTTGVLYSDNKSLFKESKGINNTASICGYSMQSNATATTISNTTDYFKILGTTTANSINQKFTHTNNRATYSGALKKPFKISVSLTASAGNNHDISFVIRKVKFSDSSISLGIPATVTTDGTGKRDNITVFWLVELEENDYIEVWCRNASATTSITVSNLDVIITEV